MRLLSLGLLVLFAGARALVPTTTTRAQPRGRVASLVLVAATGTAAASPPLLQVKDRGRVQTLANVASRALKSQMGELGLAVVNGLTVALVIKNAKMLLGRLEPLRARAPVLAPLVGAALVSLIYLAQPDLATGAATIGSEASFSLRRQLMRFAAVLLAVGSGNALALAGPAAEIGMTIARVLSGRRGGSLSRALILSGAAAGFAANFDAPLAGVLYAIEVSKKIINVPRPDEASMSASQQATVLQVQVPNERSSQREVGILMLAAYSAATVVRGGWRGFPTYTRGALALPHYPVIASSEYPLLLLVALAGALTTSLINGPLKETLGWIFGKMPARARPLVGGGVVSLAQLGGLPQALPAIFTTYGSIARGALSRGALARFLVVKSVCISACSASGLVGGMIAPYLIVGSAVGGLLGAASSSAASFAAVGSVAVLAPYFQAPLTFAVLLVEMTQALHLSAPLLLVASVSAAVCEARGKTKTKK